MELAASIVRLVQLLFLLICTALIGNVIDNNRDAAGSAESAVNFGIFVCALAWIAALYGLVAHFVSAARVPLVQLVLDALAALFTFIGAVVLSAKLSAVNCAAYGHKGSSWIAFGSDNTEKRCREIQAGLVFMWFLFATFLATLFFSFRQFRSGGGSVGRPSMSQIGV
ncbi:marvel domain-containing protein [Xylariaceae sp. FL0804]|nr:marvel domain-containing protein [Xylariaceae sp. FL0804]